MRNTRPYKLSVEPGALRRVLKFFAGMSLLVTLLALLAQTFWVFELFTHFRVQLLALQLVLFVVFAVARSPAWAIALGAACIVNGTWVREYLLPVGRTVAEAALTPAGAEAPAAVTSAETPPAELRVLSANVLASNRDTAALIDVVRAVEPDVFAVLELTPDYAAGLVELHGDFAQRVLQPETGRFGLGVYSRLPVVDYTVLDLEGFLAIDARIASQDLQWHFIAVHLVPPMSGLTARLRNTQLDRLAEHVSSRTAPSIVVGDLNLSPFSPYFRQFTERTGLQSAMRGFGPGYTWPSAFAPLGIPIDHILIDDAFLVADYFRADDIGSDHFPVIADINRRLIRLD